MDYTTSDDNLSEQQLTVAYWWVRHRSQLKKWWVASLAVIDLVLFLYILYGVLRLLIGWPGHVAMIEQMASTTLTPSADSAPAYPLVGDVVTSSSSLMASVTNENDRWFIASLDYHFEANGVRTAQKRTFLYPGVTRYFADTFVPASHPVNAKFVIDHIVWKKLSSDDIALIPSFVVEKERYDTVDLHGGGSAGLVTADVTNPTAQDFSHVPVTVVLFDSRDTILAVKTQVLPEIASLETVAFVLRLTETVPGARKVRVLPTVNIF